VAEFYNGRVEKLNENDSYIGLSVLDLIHSDGTCFDDEKILVPVSLGTNPNPPH
jgi:hypothetical protein